MKRTFLIFVLLLAAVGGVYSEQGGTTQSGTGSGVTITTVSGLASVSGKTKGTIAVVTDGNSATDCATGGASTIVVCQFSGSTWSQMVAASSGSTAFSAISGGTNTAGLIMGTGGSLGTSGSGTITATAAAANAITGAMMANATVTATQLAAQYSKGSCTEAWGGSGASHALTSGDDAVANNSCFNDSGVTRTITAVKCRNDNAANTTTVNPTFGAAGTGTTILSAALTCGNSYAYSSSGTVSNASWTTGTGIDPAMAGTLTGTSIAIIIEYTY